jgi:hypothetical protein
MLHCWKDYRTYLEETGHLYSKEWAETYETGNMTCMLEKDHEGSHDFTPDSYIEIASTEETH